MKLTKRQLKKMVKEELGKVQEGEEHVLRLQEKMVFQDGIPLPISFVGTPTHGGEPHPDVAAARGAMKADLDKLLKFADSLKNVDSDQMIMVLHRQKYGRG